MSTTDQGKSASQRPTF